MVLLDLSTVISLAGPSGTAEVKTHLTHWGYLELTDNYMSVVFPKAPISLFSFQHLHITIVQNEKYQNILR